MFRRAGRAQSVQRLDTGWTVRGSNPGRARFLAHVQTGPGAHPASYTVGTGSFTGVKRPGRDVDHPIHLASRLKKEQSYTSTPFLGLRALFYGELFTCLYGTEGLKRTQLRDRAGVLLITTTCTDTHCHKPQVHARKPSNRTGVYPRLVSSQKADKHNHNKPRSESLVAILQAS